jgi:pimeloyl-ACP methyl ester carboxylesterase
MRAQLVLRLGLTAALVALLGTVPPAVRADTRQVGTIEFRPCEIAVPGSALSFKAECSRYSVAENPDAPTGRRISLRLALVAARASKPQPDWLVYLAGGPGQSAVDSFGSYAMGFQELLKTRNLLLVDQRGTGGSNALKCPQTDFSDERLDDPAVPRDHTAQCLEAVSTHADPRFYTTGDAIRDLESLRHALGDPLFDLVGASYGTRVALSYLQRYPQGVRSLVLDSVAAQDEALGQHHARNLDAALSLIFGGCRADATCAQRFGDPAASLLKLREQLRRQPQTVTLDDPRTQAARQETLSETTLAGILRLYAYQAESAALLPLLIDEAVKGRAQPLLAQGLLIQEGLQDALAQGMALSVSCTEDVPFYVSQPDTATSLLGNRLVDALQAQCVIWPRGVLPKDFKQPVVSDKPALLLAGAWDPVTPPADAERAASSLSNSRVLVVPGAGHIVLRSGCLPKLAARFVDTLDARALDTQCMDVLGPTPAFVSVQGPAP